MLYVTDVHTRSRVTIDRGTAIYGASFSPSGRDIVWARKRGDNQLVEGRVDLFRARVDGTQSTRLTQDGRSTYPVWGPTRIAFGRVRRRAWVRSARTPLLGNLVRVGWDKSQTILAKDADQLADWNL